MRPKKIRLVLEDIRGMGYDTDHFKVAKVTNSVDWRIGKCLSEQDVRDILLKPDVEVEIKPVS